MSTFVFAFVVFLLAFLGLGLGLLLGRSPLKGSCGGLGSIPGIKPDCGGQCQGRNSGNGECPRRRSASDAVPEKP